MPVKYWRGGASTRAQVTTVTVGGTVEAGDKFLLQITGEDGSTKTVSTTCTTTSTSTTATEIAASFNADTDPLFTPITATVVGSGVVLTADTAGTPFVVSASTTENDDSGADAQTFVAVATTTNRGPRDWNSIDNWSDGVKPVSTDTVTLDGRAANSILYGLNQSGVTLASLLHYRSMAYDVGTTTAPLRIGATSEKINQAPTDGSSPSGAATVNINNGTIQTALEVYGSRSNGAAGTEPVMWQGTHASNTIKVFDGTLGIATSKPGDTATVLTADIIGRSARAVFGSGCTLTTINQVDGRVTLRAAATTVNQDGGDLYTEGSGAITTLNVRGRADLRSTGTITNLHVQPTGDVTFEGTTAARTVTNGFIYGGGQIHAALPTIAGAAHAVTATNGIDFLHGARTNQADFGESITATYSAT